MAGVEKFHDKLTCPKCGKTGEVVTIEKDGAAYLADNTTYAGVVEGFRGEDGLKSDYAKYFCLDCNVQADLK